jgi:anti-sigma factor RsiW
MSHLGERLSALVDGELDGAERDKATAHLARCELCRAEAAALRDLKRQLRSLAAESPAVAAVEADMVTRLMSMAGLGHGQNQGLNQGLAARRRLHTPRGLRPPGTPGKAGSPGPRRTHLSRYHRRYLVLGTMSIVVSLGTAAFSAGGGDPAPAPGPKITPQLQLFSAEHALTTGEVPFEGGPSSVVPAVRGSGGPARQP